MTHEQRLKNLEVPDKTIDVVLDTDAYNEIDDQFAISYLLKSKEKLMAEFLRFVLVCIVQYGVNFGLTIIAKQFIEKWDGKLPSTYAGEDILSIFSIK